MEFETNLNVPYSDPNAYVQNGKTQSNEIKKVVFQQPYECVPPYYVNNNFKKHNCDCVNSKRPNCDCDKAENQKCEHRNKPNFPFPFDIKNLLPLISNLGATNNGGIGNILSILGGQKLNNENVEGGMDLSKIISTVMSNSGGFNLLDLFGNKKRKEKRDIKTTDIPIENYTRVE